MKEQKLIYLYNRDDCDRLNTLLSDKSGWYIKDVIQHENFQTCYTGRSDRDGCYEREDKIIKIDLILIEREVK